MKHKYYVIHRTVQAIHIIKSNWSAICDFFDIRDRSAVTSSDQGTLKLTLTATGEIAYEGDWVLRNSIGQMHVMKDKDFRFLYREVE